MNIQAMMKQAQQLQKDMMKAKDQIDTTEYECTKSFVTVKAMGNKKIKSIKIELEEITSDEKEMLEDMLLVSINELMEKIDKDTESKLGKYTQGMPGLF